MLSELPDHPHPGHTPSRRQLEKSCWKGPPLVFPVSSPAVSTIRLVLAFCLIPLIAANVTLRIAKHLVVVLILCWPP